MNTLWGYFDILSKSFYDPRRNGAPVHGWAIPRLDQVRFRIAVTMGKAKITAATGIPLSQYQLNLGEYTSALFALKTNANFLDDASGDLDFTNGGGYETADTSWHGAAVCCVTLAPIVIPITVKSGLYNQEIVLLKTNRRWTLRPDNGAYAPPCEVQRDVYTGSESNAPAGLPGGLRGTWTISGAVPYTDVTVTGATSGCQLAVGVTPSTGGAGDAGTITQEPLAGGANTVRLRVASAPGAGGTFNGTWTLLNL